MEGYAILSSFRKRVFYIGRTFTLIDRIRALGVTAGMEDYEKRKLAVFNQLNFFQFLTGTIVPVIGMIRNAQLAAQWLVPCLPPLISIFVLLLNAKYKFQAAKVCYFIFYPLLISAVYLSRVDLGVELCFVLCGILAVFFFQEIIYMVMAICFPMISYFVLFLVRRHYGPVPLPIDQFVYMINQLLSIAYIFYALYLVKIENAHHRNGLLKMYAQLQLQNKAIEDQQQVIIEKASILQKQTAKLRESNKVKSKLFSIISHDLRDPMFALRNFFQQASKKGLSTEQLNELMPDIIHDLNHSSVLLENLLEWAKGQMRADTVKWQNLEIDTMMEEVAEMLQLQLKAKNIQLIKNCESTEFAQGDRDMILLVLRNLVSNAIKFTPEGGQIILGCAHSIKGITIYVKDNGRGINKEQMKKINKNIFYTTCGTKNETGSGLGLMLSKEFLFRNESQLLVESEPGEGSTFSFTLKLATFKLQDGLSRSGYSDSQDPRALLV